MKSLAVVMLDNVDSFTYNLVDELRTLNVDMTVYRNTVSAQTVLQALIDKAQHQPTVLLLSPGPGNPQQAGCMLELIGLCEGRFPVLGICLGHQAIVEHFGGEITRAATVMHGKASNITHCGDKMFSAMPQPMAVARYHSLMAQNLPESLSVLAQYEDVPMAVYHDTANMLGFQFHPESILTSDGSALLKASIAFLVQRGESYES